MKAWLWLLLSGACVTMPDTRQPEHPCISWQIRRVYVKGYVKRGESYPIELLADSVADFPPAHHEAELARRADRGITASMVAMFVGLLAADATGIGALVTQNQRASYVTAGFGAMFVAGLSATLALAKNERAHLDAARH